MIAFVLIVVAVFVLGSLALAAAMLAAAFAIIAIATMTTIALLGVLVSFVGAMLSGSRSKPVAVKAWSPDMTIRPQ